MTFFYPVLSFFSRSNAQLEPRSRYSHFMAQKTCFRPTTVLFGLGRWVTFFWGNVPKDGPKRAWIRGRHLRKSKNHHILAAFWPISTKFCVMTQFQLKIHDGGCRHLEKWKNCHILAAVWPILTKFNTVTQFRPRADANWDSMTSGKSNLKGK